MVIRTCDRCGATIELRQLRYLTKIQVFAAYDPLDITTEDLARDHAKEIQEILGQCEGLTEEELMRDVYVELQFDLCRSCQRAFLGNPLGATPPASTPDRLE